MKFTVWFQRVLALAACGVAFLCLWSSTEGAVENPNDLSDVAGIPVISMYLVILLILLFLSLCTLIIGFLIESVLGRKSRSWRILGYYFGSFIIFLNSALGLFISLAFNSDSLDAGLAIIFYGAAIGLMVSSWISFK